MIEVRKTSLFVSWLNSLRDLRAKAQIQVRIDRIELGLLSDAKFFDASESVASTKARDIGSPSSSEAKPS